MKIMAAAKILLLEACIAFRKMWSFVASRILRTYARFSGVIRLVHYRYCSSRTRLSRIAIGAISEHWNFAGARNKPQRQRDSDCSDTIFILGRTELWREIPFPPTRRNIKTRFWNLRFSWKFKEKKVQGFHCRFCLWSSRVNARNRETSGNDFKETRSLSYLNVCYWPR